MVFVDGFLTKYWFQETRNNLARGGRRLPPDNHRKENHRRHRASQATGDGVPASACAAAAVRRDYTKPHTTRSAVGELLRHKQRLRNDTHSEDGESSDVFDATEIYR